MWGIGAVLGWVLALGLGVVVLRLRRRLELVGDAAHELRGPVAALSYAVAWLRREQGGLRRALRFEAELERMRAGLVDLDAARAGRRAPARPRTVVLERAVERAADGWRAAVTGADRGVKVRWDAGPVRVRADAGRLARAFGNLLANAAEHGSGPIEVRAARAGAGAVRVEIRDRGPAVRPGRRGATRADRGRGLRIAERAIRDAGGRLTLDIGRRGTVAVVELPVVPPSANQGAAPARDTDRLAAEVRRRAAERRDGAPLAQASRGTRRVG